ncbi:MAG: FkbM family methyltransferase [Bacteroidota bacterium]
MIKLLRRIKWLAQWYLKTKSLFWTFAFFKHEIPPVYSVSTSEAGDLVIIGSDFRIPKKENIDYLLEAFAEVHRLALSGARFIPGNPWHQIEFDGMRFNVYTAQSIRIIAELFLLRIYEISLRDKPVVIDIGMNVGISVLFFAKTLGCRVYGYEPFEDTYKKAIANIKLNPRYARSIAAFQAGVGSSNRKEEFLFCPDAAGDCGIVPIPEDYRQGRQSSMEKVEIRSAAEIVSFVLKKERSRSIVLKIDCEGMEYEIIECLADARLLSKISAIIMEWHRRGNLGDPVHLHSTLASNGFVIFGNPHKISDVGISYAVNSKVKLK